MIYETTIKGTLQNSYLAIFGDDVEVVAREVDMRAHILHAPLELGEVEAYMHTNAHTHTHTHEHTHTHSHTNTENTHEHTRTHTDTHTRTHEHTLTYSHTNTQACTHTRAHTHMQTHTRTHTHKHTSIYSHTRSRTHAHTHTRTHTHTHTSIVVLVELAVDSVNLVLQVAMILNLVLNITQLGTKYYSTWYVTVHVAANRKRQSCPAGRHPQI